MITIQQQPQLYTPVYNPMRFVLSSNNTAQDNFKYVVDVYVSGHVGRVVRNLYSADPTYGVCAADISRVLESFISTDIDDTVYGFQQCTNSLKGYEVKFGEQYGPSSGIVTYPDLAVTGLKYAWNGVFSPNDFRTFDYNDHTAFNGGTILSNAPTIQYFGEPTNHAWQYMLNDTSGIVYYARIDTYDSSNVLLGTYLIQNPYQASSSIADKLIRIGVGYEDLNNATLASGSQPVITGSVAKYDVVMTRFNGNRSTGSYTYTAECSWHVTSPVALHFLNRKGGYDVFNFRMQTRQLSDIKRDTMQKSLGTLTATTWSYDSKDAGTKIYNTEIGDRWFLESDWINDDQSRWLQELVESPEKYYHDGTSLIPITIKNATYEIKTIKNMEKLFNLSVEIEFSNKRWTQRA
jgi:hypothetical protein